MDIPVVVTGQQVGSVLTEYDRKVLKTWLPKARCLGVRDALSLNTCRDLGVSEGRLIVTGDDALDLIPSKVDFPRPGTANSQPLVGLSLHVQGGAQERETVLSLLANALGLWLKRIDADIVFLPHLRSNVAHRCDVTLARDLILRMGLEGRAVLADQQEYSDTHIKYLTGQCQFIVTTRFHGAVFALSSGVPMVAVSQDAYTREKLSGLFDYFGLACPMGEISSPLLSDVIQASWNSRHAWGVEVEAARIRTMVRFHSTVVP